MIEFVLSIDIVKTCIGTKIVGNLNHHNQVIILMSPMSSYFSCRIEIHLTILLEEFGKLCILLIVVD